jgi:hypothetical protein
MELTVERGRGYISFESREGMQIGTIPVDAIFTPIPKVNYLVQSADAEMLSAASEENNSTTAYEQEELEGREQLLIEIWTDGTIDPGEALSLAAQYLAQHSSLISNFNKQVAAPTGRELPGAVQIPAHLFEMPIEDLNLSMRTYNCLKRSGITKVGQVLRMDRKELLGLRNFGEKSFDELHQSLSSRELIPPGTPLDLSEDQMHPEGEEGEGYGEDGEGDGDVNVEYGEYEASPEPNAFMELGDGLSDDLDVQGAEVVDAAGVSEGTLEASGGIYLDDEPASEPTDILPDDGNSDLGQEEARPKAKKRK